MELGFFRVASAVPAIKVADCYYNATKIIEIIKEAQSKNVEVITFPELSITGYTCADLFFQTLLINEAEKNLKRILDETENFDIISIVGMPLEVDNSIINAAVVIQRGRILGIVPKTYLPHYKEFNEQRWFASAPQIKHNDLTLCGQTAPLEAKILFRTPKATFSVEICEDVWATIAPSTHCALNGAEVIFNLSADNESIGKHKLLLEVLMQQSFKCICAYVFSSCGFGESTTDSVFAGNAIITEFNSLLAEGSRFSLKPQLVISDIDIDLIRHSRRINTTYTKSRELNVLEGGCMVKIDRINKPDFTEKLYRDINKAPFYPKGTNKDELLYDAFNIQTTALAKRFVHTNAKTAVIGISGGLDSTLALLVCAKTFDMIGKDRKDIIGVTMPGFGTTDRTYTNAIELMKSLGVTIREISIKDACIQHFKDIDHDITKQDVTYENSQARERTQILMDIANQSWGMVVGTGDLSELALGWATYNGDHMSMYGVNASVPKTMVQDIVRWVANKMDEKSKNILLDILDTPISPELIPADNAGNIKQKTEDLVGPYELHDFFIYHFVNNGFTPEKIFFLAKEAFAGEYDEATIKHWLSTFCRRFFNQQFKRSCLPDGPQVSISLSPRSCWRMPSDASSAMWLDDCEKIK